MPHMLAQEHMGYVSALRYGTARNQATINAAIAAIGSSVAWLVLDFTGDGAWAVTSNTSIPRLYVPMGVTVNVATGVTLGVDQVLAASSAWKTGPGTLNISASGTPMQVSHLACTSYFQSNSATGAVWTLNAGAGNPSAINMYTDQGGIACGIEISRNIGNVNSTWEMLANTPGDWILTRPGGSPRVLVNNTGMMLGANVSPSFLLHLSTDSAAKPGGGSFANTASDSRVKTVDGEHTRGMAFLLTLPPVQMYHYNGKAQTPVDGKTYVGFIADEIFPVEPSWVGEYSVKLEPEDASPVMLKTLDTSELIYVHHNALKEVHARLLALESPTLRRAEAPDEVAAPEEESEDQPRSRRRRKE